MNSYQILNLKNQLSNSKANPQSPIIMHMKTETPPKNISSKLKIKLRVSLHETPDSCRSTFQFINHPNDKKKSPPQFQTKPAATMENATFSSHVKY